MPAEVKAYLVPVLEYLITFLEDTVVPGLVDTVLPTMRNLLVQLKGEEA